MPWQLKYQQPQDRNPYTAVIDGLVKQVLSELNEGAESSKATNERYNVCAVLVPVSPGTKGKPSIMIGFIVATDNPILQYVAARGGVEGKPRTAVVPIGGFLPLDYVD